MGRLADPRACEIKNIEVVDTVGDQAGPNGAEEHLLIIGDSGDALRSLSSPVRIFGCRFAVIRCAGSSGAGDSLLESHLWELLSAT
ncbi:MAG: hypothetical protein AB7L13_03765 [Acidimicrobiia bacterium]